MSKKKPANLSEFRLRPLDPQRICGEGTSVQLLFRVDERSPTARTVHLVYFDMHGWYCDHGPNCVAVQHARKASGLARYD